MTTSLLPPNATPLERALEAGSLLAGVDTPVDVIDDPLACPAELLPWLAWGLSVDTWDPNWSEADKRQAVAHSIALHRIKGTRASVEAVLARFDAMLELVEWHQQSPRAEPHTFEVLLPIAGESATPGGRRATAAFAEAIVREVSRVKPVREHFRLAQQLVVRGSIGIRAVARAAAAARADTSLHIDLSPEWDAWLQTEHGEPLQDEGGAFLDTRP